MEINFMKPISQYPTPETDEALVRCYPPMHPERAFSEMKCKAESLERRLAACRKGFQKLYDAQDSCIDLTPELLTECRIILTLTAPKL
jgi:hypothetical protein